MTIGLHRPAPHLLLALSSHGFGHLTQAAPVVNQLRQLIPDLRLTVRGAFPEAQINKRILNPDVLQGVADDFGMVMRDALTVDVDASLKAYQIFHAGLTEKTEILSQALIDQKVDLVLSDIPYLTLAAAQHAGIPCVALCSLNWADILEHCLAADQAQDIVANQLTPSCMETGVNIVQQIREIYQRANHFLLPAPSMPMRALRNTRSIGPVCDPGSNRRAVLLTNTQITGDCWLVLVGMGGMPFEFNLDAWPTHIQGKRLCYIVSDAIAQKTTNSDVRSESNTGLTYSDLVASVDLIITKPGYGMFVEAAAAGAPVLYVERRDWPEAEALTDWLQSVAHCTEISTTSLLCGSFGSEIQRLLELGRYTPVPPTGNLQAATLLADYLLA